MPMKVFFRDSFGKVEPTSWRGLRVRIESSGAPGLMVSVVFPSMIRVSLSGAPLLWARVEDGHYGYELLRAPGTAVDSGTLGVIPPISSELMHAHDGRDRVAAWARTYARLLEGSVASPLYDGDWHLGALAREFRTFELAPSVVRQIVDQKPYGYIKWDFGDVLYPITLRDMSPPESGRVKLWRKLARKGALPPVLLHRISGLDACVVLDGHDRLLAASLERTSAPVLTLEATEEIHSPEQRRRDVVAAVERSLEAAELQRRTAQGERLARVPRLFTHEDSNRILLDTFSPELRAAPTRARLIPGGAAQWVAEVRAALAVRGIRETALLAGYE